VIPAALALAVYLAGAGAPAPDPSPAPLPDADPIGFQARADRARVKLGEPFGYWVEIRHAPEEWYLLRGAPALAPFRVDGVRCRRDADRREVRTTCTLRLALFALGEVDVPDLVFEVDRPGGKARLAVPGPRITGVGILDPALPAEGIALRDVAPPAPLLVRSWRPLLWAVGGLAALALLVLLAAAVPRRRGARRPRPGLSPAERLERRLAALEAERLPQRGRGEEHVARLSEAVREYLAATAGVPLDLTSAELVSALTQARPPDPRLDLAGLELFLGDADRVKFARQPADPELCAAGLAFARALLERTRPAPGGEREAG
jgi:hypothetical protein